MAKTGLILTSVDDDDSIRLNSGSSMQDGVITINKKIYFRVPDGENPRQYSDLDVYAHPLFPQRYSALSQDARYKFYGNASISHERDDSKYFIAELEYSTNSNSNFGSSGEDQEVTADTPPWELLPDNLSFTYPERQIPFQAAYNSSGQRYNSAGQVLIPVQNSAGTPFVAQTTARDMEMSFTFAAKKWNINNSINYGNTINSSEIEICGVTIPARRALLRPPECDFITTYEDNTGKKKWEYWNVKVNILITFSPDGFAKRVLNVGDECYWNDLVYPDITLKGTKPGQRSRICSFRKYVKVYTDSQKKSYVFHQTGDIVFCSWDQFLAFRGMIIAQSSDLSKTDDNYKGGILDPQCEQLSQMPLTSTGFLDEKAIETKQYGSLTFLEYPTKSWKSLNFPSRYKKK